MEQLQNGLAVKDLLESLLLWQAGQGSEDDLRLMVRQALHQRLPEYQVDMLEEGALPEAVLRAIADDLASNLSSDTEKLSALSFTNPTQVKKSSLPEHSVLEIELLPDAEVPPPEELLRRRWDPISLYHGVDGVIRFLTWDYLSLPGMVVVACIIAVASLPFVLENPEFSKDGSPLLRFGESRPRPSQYALPEETRTREEKNVTFAAMKQSKEDSDSPNSDAKAAREVIEFTPDAASQQTPEDRLVDNDANAPKSTAPAAEASEVTASGDAAKEKELDLDALLAPILSESDSPKAKQQGEDLPETSPTSAAGEADETAQADSNEVSKLKAVPADARKLELVNIEPVDLQLSDVTKPEVRPEPFYSSRDQSLSPDELPVAKGILVAPPPSEHRTLTAEMLLPYLKQGRLDWALAQLQDHSHTNVNPSLVRQLQLEKLVRINDAESRRSAWSLLADQSQVSFVEDLICARLLLNASRAERKQFQQHAQSQPTRYLAWLGSWQAGADRLARSRLQQCMFQHPTSTFLDSIFMANANFALGDMHAAHDGLVRAKDRLKMMPLESRTPVVEWLIEESVEALNQRLERTIQALSQRITKTAAH